MAEPQILESYLVSLSMKGPSTTQHREAEKAFDSLASAISVIVPTITAAATAVVYATDKIAAGLSKLQFESQKTGTTVRELSALGYAFEQNGSTLEKFTTDFDKFAQKLRDFPEYTKLLRDDLKLKPEDFNDPATLYSATLKALASKRAAGDTQSEGAFRNLFGFDEDNIVARGRKEFDKFYAEGYERNKGIDEESVKALSLVRSLNAFGAALEAVGHKVAAELFDKYGIVLGDMTQWVDDHSKEIVSVVGKVVDQFVQVWKDIEPIAVPATHKIAAGLEVITVALDRILGSPDGQHGGLHAIRYVLDTLAIYIASRWAPKLLGMLGLRGIGGAALGILGLGGGAALAVAGAAAYGVLSNVPKAEGDDSYGLDHPGWHPGMPKEKTQHQKEVDGAAPPVTDDGKPTGYHGESGLGMPGQAHGETMVETTDAHGHSYVINKKHAEQFNSFLNDLQSQGYNVKTVGGFEDRANKNDPGKLSKHAIGKAIDINADQNPNQRTLETDMPSGISELARKHGLKWGGDFKGTKDPMHFEIEKEHQSFLAGAHHMLASLHRNPQTLAMLTAKPASPSQWTRTNNIGSRKQVTNIQLASTDPHTAASEIARHMKVLHAGTMRSLDRLA